MIQQNNDNCAVPQGCRKAATISSEKMRGGKAITDDEQVYQLDLFFGAAERSGRPPTENRSAENRKSGRLQKVRKPKDKSKRGIPATVEQLVEYLDEAMWNVTGNRGAPGPDRQTVEMVREHWEAMKPELSKSLLLGTYEPGAIRRVWIPKSGGGERGLGIPDVLDRIVQEAYRMSLEPLYEPYFHRSSHGFRPNRSCHTAIEQARQYRGQGYAIVVDLDLKDYFNRVNHQRLLAKLARRVADKRMLILVGKMLKAQVVMPDGVVIQTERGVPQGGPLSPLLSNIYLDELDWELDRRGHKFVRYADDCNIYVYSERAGLRVMASIRSFIEKWMRLEVNEQKSAVARPEERHFVGFRLWYNPQTEKAEMLLSQRTRKRIREKMIGLTPRNYGNALKACIKEINVYLKGWIGFFGVCAERDKKRLLVWDAHIRRRLRAIQLKQWKRKRTIARNLIQRGMKEQQVMKTIYGKRRSWWALSHTPVVDKALPNAYWAEKGLLSLHDLWCKLKKAAVAPVQMKLDLV